LACTRDTEIAVGGGRSPVFTVNGTAKLTSFKIWGPKAGEPEGKATELIWQIEPAGGQGGRSLDGLRQVQYGVVPEGFVQRVPATNGPPPPSEGIIYQAEIGTANAPMLNLRFAVRNGQTVNWVPPLIFTTSRPIERSRLFPAQQPSILPSGATIWKNV
jgi:hypothetical protein